MMLAEMYGMMPSAKIDRFASAPPEKRLNRPSRPLLACHDVAHDSAVHTRRGDEHADPVDREDAESERDAPAQLRHLGNVREPA